VAALEFGLSESSSFACGSEAALVEARIYMYIYI